MTDLNPNLDRTARRSEANSDAIHTAAGFFEPDTSRLAGLVQRRARMRGSPERELDTAAQLHSRAQLAVAAMFEEARAGGTPHVRPWFALLDAVSSSLARNPNAMFALIRSRQENRRTVMRAVSVCMLMMVLSQRMGRCPTQVREAGIAGMLHDIGGRTSSASPDACLHHPKRHEGSGLPDFSVESETGGEARMLAICEAYDEMTSRPLNEGGLEPAHAVARMAELTRQGRFDGRLFLAFVECVGIYPIGSLVRLGSGRLGLVTEQSGKVPYAPHVKVFYSTGAARPISVETVDLSRADCGDEIVARESNADWQFRALDPLLVGGSSRPQRIGRGGADDTNSY